MTTYDLYCADCEDVLPTLVADACITDPPYGIARAEGMGGGGYDGFGNNVKRNAKVYVGKWDNARPSAAAFAQMLSSAAVHVIWGGNYFSDMLPQSDKWLVWNKLQTMPSFSDAELAWTSLSGTATKMFTYNGSGLHAREKQRFHPTQKPVALMEWCIELCTKPGDTVIDPYMGVGSTGVACMRTQRNFIGIERDPRYYVIANKRIVGAAAQLHLFPQRTEGEQLSMFEA